MGEFEPKNDVQADLILFEERGEEVLERVREAAHRIEQRVREVAGNAAEAGSVEQGM